ncbi:hypothetical protein WA158_008269 [Blastocystis sp. Blastoise]
MNKILIRLLLLLPCVYGLVHSSLYYSLHYKNYVIEYNKKYDDKEYNYRLSVFSKNIDFIDSENKKNHSFTLGLTRFSDISNEEFRSSRLCGCSLVHKNNNNNKHNNNNNNNTRILLNKEDIPESIDWRDKGIVNEIQDQIYCGSCWAFSAVSSCESVYAQKTNKLLKVSEQQLVDCDHGNFGCSGGVVAWAFNYIKKIGLCSEESYPYVNREDECKSDSCDKILTISDSVNIAEGDGESLRIAISKQPVSLSLAAGTEFFHHYTSGILDSEECGTSINHAVVAVGYGKENDKEYILIRNCWGKEWGENGYIRIAYQSSGLGICGINTQATYPIA